MANEGLAATMGKKWIGPNRLHWRGVMGIESEVDESEAAESGQHGMPSTADEVVLGVGRVAKHHDVGRPLAF